MQAVKFVRDTLSIDTETLGEQLLVNCAKTSMSSKIVGSDSEFFAKIAVQATQTVKVTKSDGKISYPISAINVLKAHGKSAKESQVIQGYAITTGRASQVRAHNKSHSLHLTVLQKYIITKFLLDDSSHAFTHSGLETVRVPRILQSCMQAMKESIVESARVQINRTLEAQFHAS